MQAVTKEDVTLTRGERVFPEFVIQAFNDEIIAVSNGRVATVDQNKVMERILTLKPELTRNEVFENKWLDVEEFYRKAGWNVVYVKPAYYETFAAYFVFS
jgi:hypothetical protein